MADAFDYIVLGSGAGGGCDPGRHDLSGERESRLRLG